MDSAVHVGNIVERNNSFTKDFNIKRGNFIGKIHSILQEFYFANPLVKMEMFSIYATSFMAQTCGTCSMAHVRDSTLLGT